MVYARFYESAYAVITSAYVATRTCCTTRDRSADRSNRGWKMPSRLSAGNILAQRTCKERSYINLRLLGPPCNLRLRSSPRPLLLPTPPATGSFLLRKLPTVNYVPGNRSRGSENNSCLRFCDFGRFVAAWKENVRVSAPREFGIAKLWRDSAPFIFSRYRKRSRCT